MGLLLISLLYLAFHRTRRYGGRVMNRLMILTIILLAFANAASFIEHQKLAQENKELTMQVQDMGDELDNLETKLQIDKESIQN